MAQSLNHRSALYIIEKVLCYGGGGGGEGS